MHTMSASGDTRLKLQILNHILWLTPIVCPSDIRRSQDKSSRQHHTQRLPLIPLQKKHHHELVAERHLLSNVREDQELYD